MDPSSEKLQNIIFVAFAHKYMRDRAKWKNKESFGCNCYSTQICNVCFGSDFVLVFLTAVEGIWKTCSKLTLSSRSCLSFTSEMLSGE